MFACGSQHQARFNCTCQPDVAILRNVFLLEGKDLTIRINDLNKYCLDIEVNMPASELTPPIFPFLTSKHPTYLLIDINTKRDRENSTAQTCRSA